MSGLSGIIPELIMGMQSLLVHKLRSLLTMLGMIFGVGAVVAMLSITAGAQKEMMSFIDQLGVNNIIVEAHEALDRNELQTIRAISPRLTPASSRHPATAGMSLSTLIVGAVSSGRTLRSAMTVESVSTATLPSYVEPSSASV